jgi:hypothetical protein
MQLIVVGDFFQLQPVAKVDGTTGQGTSKNEELTETAQC